MSNPDAFGHKIFWGWVMWFLGKYRNKINRSAFKKKVPVIMRFGRSVRHVHGRPAAEV